MITARLFLSGITASGRHGAREGEKDESQPFVVDLDLTVAVAEDRIEATADYRGITERVRAIVEGESFDLIEVLADRIANEILRLEHVVGVTALVHKPSAATRLEVDAVSSSVTAGDAE
jgi:7,8-dihydroneopterin aldolase/epimerase/oxygenase